MSISKNNTNEFFRLEYLRQRLASQKSYTKLEKTYKSKLSLSNDNTGDFWDAKFFSIHEIELRNPMELDRNTTASRWFSNMLISGYRTLNIGCGDGNFETLIYKIPKSFSHTGADIALKTIKKLRARFSKFSFISFDLIKEKFDKKYDVICLFEVLEHIQTINTFRVLRKIFNALEKGGLFIISVPMNEGLDINYPFNPNEHQRMYTQDLILAELKIAGFEIIRSKVFFAFNNHYQFKTIIARHIFVNKWKPNNILVLCRKP